MLMLANCKVIIFYRTHLKTIDADRNKLLALKDAFEKKEIDFNKQSSELRVQVIELRESNVIVDLMVKWKQIDDVTLPFFFFNF